MAKRPLSLFLVWLLMVAGLTALPLAQAAGEEEPVHPLADWRFDVNVTKTLVGGGYTETLGAQYSDTDPTSQAMTWTGSRQGSARFYDSCQEGYWNGYDIEGSGTGAGTFQQIAVYWSAEDWGLSPDQTWTSFGPQQPVEPAYQLYTTSYNCDGTATYGPSGTEGPVSAPAWLPGTIDDLVAHPVGTTLSGSNQLIVNDDDDPTTVTETTTVTWTAEKGLATEPASFSCASAGVEEKKVYAPEYTARVVFPLAPDAHLYTFAPAFVACYNGTLADIGRTWSSTGIDYGGDTAALELLGFTLDYDPDKTKVWADKPGEGEQFKYAYAQAFFYVTFDPLVLIDKLGVKGKIEDKAKTKLSKDLAKVLAKYGPSSPEVDRELLKWAKQTSDYIMGELDRVDDDLEASGVPESVANFMEDLAEKRVGELLDDYTGYIEGLVSSDELHALTAEQIAEKVVGDLVGQISLDFDLRVWQPAYSYRVSGNGDITRVTSLDTEYANPFLTIAETIQ